jgi:alpha-D-ribose 1-methylphosphonate 5-triphosphate synthase subunit PhnG
MFHTFDSSAPDAVDPGAGLQRPGWMALLARAPVDLLEAGLGPYAETPTEWLRPPETGLMMVEGRAGGTGERFNLGEITVTRCALRLPQAGADGAVGVAYVLGRHHHQARLAAVADALLQDPEHQAEIATRLLEPVRGHLTAQHQHRAQQTQTTQVEFFTVARESNAPDEEDAE